MIELGELRDPVVIAAFEGWNDAADAATGAIDHLIETWDAVLVGAVDPEDYYDFQVNRPQVGFDDDGVRRLTWPTTRIFVARPDDTDRDVLLIRGIEPNMRWRTFCQELIAVVDESNAQLVVVLG
ncbi:MAG TPA: PAC2 family protein, partial [Kribbellaceae bacterium]|nr:PAC2 family protein [Kribbellaceae bacterium]